MNVFARVRAFMDRHIDYPAALAGAVVLGSLVFAVNYGHGWNEALIAAAKQATLYLLRGGRFGAPQRAPCPIAKPRRCGRHHGGCLCGYACCQPDLLCPQPAGDARAALFHAANFTSRSAGVRFSGCAGPLQGRAGGGVSYCSGLHGLHYLRGIVMALAPCRSLFFDA